MSISQMAQDSYGELSAVGGGLRPSESATLGLSESELGFSRGLSLSARSFENDRARGSSIASNSRRDSHFPRTITPSILDRFSRSSSGLALW